MRTTLAALSALLFTLFSTALNAQTTPASPLPPTLEQDEVTTTSGRRVVGRVVEVHPSNTSIAIRTRDELITLRWNTLGTMHGPSFPANDPLIFSPTPVLGRGRLRVESPSPQELEILYGTSRLQGVSAQEGGELHRVRCTTPCTLWLPSTRVLIKSEARDIAEAESTVLVPPEGARVTLHASPRGRATVALGLGITAIGLLDVSLLAIVTAAIMNPHGGPDFINGVLIAGGISLGAAAFGAATLILEAATPTGVQSILPRAPRTPDSVRVAPWVSVSPDRAGNLTGTLGLRGTF